MLNNHEDEYMRVFTYLQYELNGYTLTIIDVPVYVSMSNDCESVLSDETIEVIGTFKESYSNTIKMNTFMYYDQIKEIILPSTDDEDGELELKHDSIGERTLSH